MDTTVTKQDNRGGSREGAGRKATGNAKPKPKATAVYISEVTMINGMGYEEFLRTFGTPAGSPTVCLKNALDLLAKFRPNGGDF